MTQGLDSLQHVRSLTLEHVKVACLPPHLEALRLVRCRLGECPLPRGWRLQSLTIDSCTGQVRHHLFCLHRLMLPPDEAPPVVPINHPCSDQVGQHPCYLRLGHLSCSAVSRGLWRGVCRPGLGFPAMILFCSGPVPRVLDP